MTESAQCAKAVRKELKQAFPNVKFSVTSDNFSMGNAVRVRYENGPTTTEVNDLVSKYQYGEFNGMEDIYENTNKNENIPQAKFVQVSRDFTEEVEAKAKQDIATKYGIEADNEDAWVKMFSMYQGQVIRKELSKVSL